MNVYPPKHVIEGARVVRGCLVDLLNANTGEVDNTLSILLVQCNEDNIRETADQIVALLEQYRETRQWLRTFVRLAVDSTKIYKDYQPTAGDPDSPSSSKYACPTCRHVWYRFSVGEPIPMCEKCNRHFERVLEDYVCPKGDYTWYIFSKETSIPQCPTHHKPLISK